MSQSDPSSRTVVLCISGAGRSGTTILSVLLSQQVNIFNLGQVRDFWRAYGRDALCSCGKNLSGCAFWSRAARQAFPDWTQEDFLTMKHKTKEFNRAAAGVRDWGNPGAIKKFKHDHADYLEALGMLLVQCRAVSGRRLFVDTSKSPEVAFAYSLLDDVDVRVLGFTRDPRAVAVSWVKKTGDKHIVRKRSAQWKYRHLRLRNWGSRLGSHYAAVRYEDFVANPQESIRKILNLLGQRLPEGLFVSEKDARVSWDEQHLFPPANERVLAEKPTDVEIVAPTSWKSKRHIRIRAQALIHTFPYGLKYIFSQSSGG